MKSHSVLLATVFLLLSTISCRKSVENNGLVGKWKLIEKYDGYIATLNPQWYVVPPQNADVLSFSADGKYQKTEMVFGTQVNCTGTYLLHTDNNLEINSSCDTLTEKAVVTELTSKTLILSQRLILYKYSSTK